MSEPRLQSLAVFSETWEKFVQRAAVSGRRVRDRVEPALEPKQRGRQSDDRRERGEKCGSAAEVVEEVARDQSPHRTPGGGNQDAPARDRAVLGRGHAAEDRGVQGGINRREKKSDERKQKRDRRCVAQRPGGGSHRR